MSPVDGFHIFPLSHGAMCLGAVGLCGGGENFVFTTGAFHGCFGGMMPWYPKNLSLLDCF